MVKKTRLTCHNSHKAEAETDSSDEMWLNIQKKRNLKKIKNLNILTASSVTSSALCTMKFYVHFYTAAEPSSCIILYYMMLIMNCKINSNK